MLVQEYLENDTCISLDPVDTPNCIPDVLGEVLGKVMEVSGTKQEQEENKDTSKKKIIYVSDTSVEIIKGFCPECIVEMYREMQNAHPFLHEKQNRLPVLEAFARDKAINIGPFILEALEKDPVKKLRVNELLSMPTFVGFRILDHMGLPQKGDVIFSSTATANSCNDDAVTSALHILGFTDPDMNITFQRSSTAAWDGLTMVSRLPPRNDAVFFNPNTLLDDFADDVARSLAQQFFAMTLKLNKCTDRFELKVLPTYDKMYHYGCISQNWTTNSLGMPVSSWGIHEQWNILMASAMMHHVALTLKPGGNAVVKVRVMRRAETLGLTALLSSLFERMEIVDVPDQICTYAGVVFFNMTHDEEKRKRVADAIWKAMDQSPAHIFCNEFMQNDDKVRTNLKACEEHRRSMMDYRSKLNTLFLDCVLNLAQQIQCKRYATTFPMLDDLVQHYGSEERGLYFWKRWVAVHVKLVTEMPAQTKRFLWVMQRPWILGKRNPVGSLL